MSKQRSEVYDMLLTEFDEERYERTIRQDALEEGIEKGENRLNKVNKILLGEGRTEDILKAMDDKEYRRQLMKEFGLL
ncbi:MAG: hypothetical protein Q4B72_10400 [Lachnospiraceae bacterium]|nr:hypothetical protein [Lachnospiraceae bacterium]